MQNQRTSWLATPLASICLVAAMAVALLAGWHPAAAFGAVPVMGNTTAALNEAMKVIFAEPLINNIVSDSELMSLFQTDMNVKSEETTGGRYIEMSHYFRLPGGVGARGENDYIPVSDPPRFANSRLFLRKIMGTVEMTGDTMRKVQQGPGAFISYMERALPDLSQRVVNEVDRQYSSYGSGIKARTTQALQGAGPYTVIVDRSLGVTGYTDPFLQFLEGERIVFSANANANPIRNPGALQSALVTGIDEATNTLTLTADSTLAAAVQANDRIFPGDPAGHSGQDAVSGQNREIQGLLAGTDDGTIVATYNNIVRGSERLWRSIVIDASQAAWGGAMAEDLLTFADDETFVKGNGKVTHLVMSRSASRGYWKSLKGDRMFVDPRAYTGGGARKLEIVLGDRTLPLRIARKLPPEVAFGLQVDTWRRLTLGSWQWDDTTGSIWNRVTDATGRKDAFYGTGYMYEELFCTAPRKNFRIDGLARVQ